MALMVSYERVTYRPEREDGGKARARTVLLEVTADGEVLLIGTEVTTEGETKWTNGGTTSTTHVIEKTLVTKRVPMRMDNHYGFLVEADDPR